MEGRLNEVNQWIVRSDQSLRAAQLLMRNGFYNDSISRSYFAMYYATRALLVRDGLDFTKPKTMLVILGKDYVKAGRLEACYHKSFLQACDARSKAEYSLLNEADAGDAQWLIGQASEFVSEIKHILSLNGVGKAYSA